MQVTGMDIERSFEKLDQLYRKGDFEASEAFLLARMEEARQEEDGKALEAFAQEAARYYYQVGCYRLAQQQLSEAQRCLEQACLYLEQTEDGQNPRYPQALCYLAGLRAESGRLKEGMELYQRALAWEERFRGENEEFAVICENMALLYQAAGDEEQAECCLRKAEEIKKRL